jgi:hypothetical protein
VLFWGAVLVLAAFGTYFSLVNYPLFSIGVSLAVLALAWYSEKKRRRKQRAWERLRSRSRARSHDLSSG